MDAKLQTNFQKNFIKTLIEAHFMQRDKQIYAEIKQ